MYTLCFTSDLTSTELAAWVQAIGSIVAILGAMGIAFWVTRKQHNNAMALHSAEQRHERIELAKTLLVVSQISTTAVSYITMQVQDRFTIGEIADGMMYCDIDEIGRLDSDIANIPVHELPSSLVTLRRNLSSTVRQFRQKVQLVINVHRSMDQAAFDDFLQVIGEMNDSLKGTCGDIVREIERMQESD